MKANLRLFLLLTAALLAIVPARAETKAEPGKNPAVIHVTVLEPISYVTGSTYNDFDRLDVALTAIARQRNWPVQLNVERLVGDTATTYDSEVRILLESVRHEAGDEYVFRARVLVTADGRENDLGLVTYRHGARYGENLDNLYEKIFRGGAEAIADKIEPLLFPASDQSPLHITLDGFTASEAAYTDYDRLQQAIQGVAQERQWSRPVTVEKLVGGTPRYANELRINFQRSTGDKFRAHVILILDGKRQDLGDIVYDHDEHSYGRNEEARRQGLFKGGAGAIADKIEPLVFPNTRKAGNMSVLHVSVVDSVGFNGSGNAYTNFDRLDVALTKMAEQRKWPVKLDVSRLAGNTPDYPTELRITIQRVNREPVQDFVIRAWVTLMLDGKKQDFGIVTGRYSGRMGENFENTFENLFRVEAEAIADKIQPVLFPDLKPESNKKK